MNLLKVLHNMASKRKYSKAWMMNLSDDLLEKEREAVRQRWCSGENVYGLLCRFGSEMSRRAWNGKKPRGPGYHREHGYNLMKDD